MGSVRLDSRLEENMSKRWYVVHAYSGFEKSVARALEDRINRAGMTEKFGKILVPVEEVVEMKGGQKHMSERKFFPGYVLVEMEMNDDTWHLVKNTNKVTGFVGGTATKPAPIPEKEVEAIMQQMREGVEKPKPKVLFEVGEMGRVKDGPFTDFQGAGGGGHYERTRLRAPGSGGDSRLREERPARAGHDFRPLGSRGARMRRGGKSLTLFGERSEAGE